MVKPTPVFSDVLNGESGLTASQWSQAVAEVAAGFVAGLKYESAGNLTLVSGICLSRAKNNIWYAVRCAWAQRKEFTSVVFAEYACGCTTT